MPLSPSTAKLHRIHARGIVLEGWKRENDLWDIEARLTDGKSLVTGIFAAVPYCLDLISGPYVETNEAVVKAFRPKSALRKKD